ncbi:LysM peptidoglycan-binding domain-containing protein [Paenibacillus kobensis]|uniref:LysM peptidoglycan-binding domain-containing protein n=1 Tax=Paenibacillus kobensis TaxID=59841 RepID=UPI0013E3F679|nr:LysM peptidoglycan-binding domain-containing protein [Paenibacillus kobensis]
MREMTAVYYRSNNGTARTVRSAGRIQAGRLNKKQAEAVRAVLRWGFAIGFAIILFCGALLVMSDASGEHPAEPMEGEAVVYVAPGDTLWSIASSTIGHKDDIRERVYEIKKRNNMQSGMLKSGQKLIIPNS